MWHRRRAEGLALAVGGRGGAEGASDSPEGGARAESPALWLVGREPLVGAWRQAFDGTGAEVFAGEILTVATGHALSSPANSFGDMSGGLDLAIRRAYAPYRIEDVVKRAIDAEADGELPVGAALVVATPGERFTHLVVAPTMRTPRRVVGTLNAYLAMRAALLAVRRWNARGQGEAVSTLVCSGLGTGTGCLLPEVAASQMRAAWDDTSLPRERRSLVAEAERERRLCVGSYRPRRCGRWFPAGS